jgi:hypothetical protein
MTDDGTETKVCGDHAMHTLTHLLLNSEEKHNV